MQITKYCTTTLSLTASHVGYVCLCLWESWGYGYTYSREMVLKMPRTTLEESKNIMNHDPICLLQNFSSLMRVQITETLLQEHRFIMTHPTPNMPPIYGLQGRFRITSLHFALSNSPTSKIWKASSNVKDAVARCSLARRASASLNSRAVSGGQACPMFQCFT